MINTFLLLKDGSILMNKKIEESPEVPELILFSADSELNTYIIHPYGDFMVKMTDATIIYEAIIMQNNYEGDFEANDIPLDRIEVSFHNPYDMFQYLHSIHRIEYFNHILQNNDALTRKEIVFGFFKIEISSNGKTLYKEKLSYQSEKGFFKAKDIYQKIQSVYDPIELKNCRLVIDPVGKRWKFSSEEKKKWLYGVPMKHTASITFLDTHIMEVFESIKDFYCYGVIFNDENIEEAEEACRIYQDIKQGDDPSEFRSYNGIDSFDYWETNQLNMIEFVTYLPYLHMLFKLINSKNSQSELQYSIQTFYEIRAFIESWGLEHFLSFDDTDEDYLTIQRLVKIITEKDDDYEEITIAE